jgi:hypothetical protein
MFRFLDNTPLTSIITVIVTLVGGVIAFAHPSDIDVFLKYAAAVGASGGGLGVLGIARSQAGKG